jgi:hypothetical protein
MLKSRKEFVGPWGRFEMQTQNRPRPKGEHVSPLRSIRQHCSWCCNDSSHEINICSAENCPSHVLRFGKRPKGIKSIRPLKVIRARCLDCSCGSTQEISDCKYNNCSLWIYRSGYNPRLKGKRVASSHSFSKNTASASVLSAQNNTMIDSMGDQL